MHTYLEIHNCAIQSSMGNCSLVFLRHEPHEFLGLSVSICLSFH